MKNGIPPQFIHTHTHTHTQASTHTDTHTHTHMHTNTHILVIPPNRRRHDIQCVHATRDGKLWCTTCNRGRFVYEYDSSLITGDVTGVHKFSSFVNVLYIRFAIDCTNSGWGPSPFSKRPRSDSRVSHVPGWRRLQPPPPPTHTHTQTNTWLARN